MKKPTKALLELNALGPIKYIFISLQGITNNKKYLSCMILAMNFEDKIDGRFSKYKKYLDLAPNNKTVARIKPEYMKQLLAWFDSQHKLTGVK